MSGSRPGEFLQRLKLDLARQLLKTTDLQISEISYRCGFSKQDVLSRKDPRISSPRGSTTPTSSAPGIDRKTEACLRPMNPNPQSTN